MITDVSRIIRALLVAVTGLPEADVRPADQVAPSGHQSKEYVTVRIDDVDGMGTPARSHTATGTVPNDVTTEHADQAEVMVVSVDFYRGPNTDGAGIAKYTNKAFDRAARLPQQLALAVNVERMRAAGLGYLGASRPRNLSGVVDHTFESRGQIDLTFNVVNRESAPVETILTVPLTAKFQAPGGAVVTTTTEVTS